ncbi:MAG: hypothetical protein AB4080_26310 [Trichodesmium sp.]
MIWFNLDYQKILTLVVINLVADIADMYFGVVDEHIFYVGWVEVDLKETQPSGLKQLMGVQWGEFI